MKLICIAVAIATTGLALAAGAQNRQIPQGIIEAGKSAQQSRAEMPPPLPPQKYTVPPDELKADAEELARLAQQIPSEIEHLNGGIHDKDLDAHLKQIEKLSKRLRAAARP